MSAVLGFLWDHLFSSIGSVLGAVALYYVRQFTVAYFEAKANTAIQNMVANFAGTVAHDVNNNGVSPATLSDLLAYGKETVQGSLDLLKVSPTTLSTMLEGKVRSLFASK